MGSKTKLKTSLPGKSLLLISGGLYFILGILGLVNLYFINLPFIAELMGFEHGIQPLFFALSTVRNVILPFVPIQVSAEAIRLLVNIILLLNALCHIFIGITGIMFSNAENKSSLLKTFISIYFIVVISSLIITATIVFPEPLVGFVLVLALVLAAIYYVGVSKNYRYISIEA